MRNVGDPIRGLRKGIRVGIRLHGEQILTVGPEPYEFTSQAIVIGTGIEYSPQSFIYRVILEIPEQGDYVFHGPSIFIR